MTKLTKVVTTAKFQAAPTGIAEESRHKTTSVWPSSPICDATTEVVTLSSSCDGEIDHVSDHQHFKRLALTSLTAFHLVFIKR